jgi:serine/threonine-protein kinase
MYETITGKPPFRGKNIVETFQKQIIEPPPPIEEELAVPAKLANIIYQSLAKDADDRPQSASEISEAINQVLSQQPIVNWSGPAQADS